MICCRHEHYAPSLNGDRGFEVDGARLKYGRGVIAELGDAAASLGMRRAGIFVDPFLRNAEFVERALFALRDGS